MKLSSCEASRSNGDVRLRCPCRGAGAVVESLVVDGVDVSFQGKASTRDKQAEERTLSHRQDENRHSTRSQVTRS